MSITASLVKELREKTGVGMMDCKKALVETDGNIEKAIEYLREKGLAKAEKKAGRVAAEGLTSVVVNGNQAVLLEVNCETDFVAKNDDFKQFINNLAEHLLAKKPGSVENALVQQLNDGGQTIQEVIHALISKIGENINFRRFQLVNKTNNEAFGAYVHMGGTISVLTVLSNTSNDTLAKDVSMHAAAMNPRFISKEEVSEDVIAKEREVLKQQALNEGKPENIVEKMVEGRLSKFYKEVSLLEQDFVKDPDLTVQKFLDKEGKDITVTDFYRYALGEGIEKKVDNFAEEVMSQVKK